MTNDYSTFPCSACGLPIGLHVGAIGNWHTCFTALVGRINEVHRVLGPTVPSGLPEGAEAEWAEALRLLRTIAKDDSGASS